ncbi:MAG: IS630 family transposase [Candidatus Moeniiplasma glomeromycotorum]|nr:IS630 family transposase [Candidatus Moeniiplasma glomeromycotorum]
MEYRAKIFSEYQLEDGKLWKYDFVDLETNKQDFFYHNEKLSYNPNSVGRLSIDKDKFFQSFEKEINQESKNFDLTENFAEIAGKLEWGTKNFLNDLPKKYRKVSIELKHLKHLKELGFSHLEIGNVYKKCERTIYRWFKPNTESLQKRGVKPKINEKVINLVRDYALEDKPKTQQEMADYVFKELGIKISRPSINTLLKRIGIAHKKLAYHYTQLDEEKTKAFNEKIKPLLPHTPFLAMDECSFYPNLDPRYGYALKSERAVSKRPSHKGIHYTLLLAISNQEKNGVIHWELVEGGANWEVFYNFLEKINPIGDKKNIFLMDNARIHTAPNKRAEAKLPSTTEQMAKKNTEVWFIPPYAPMINPTELVFNIFRQQTEKRRPRSYEEMKSAIKKVVELLNTKDLRKFFWHCATYFDRKDKKNKLRITDI